MRTLRTTEFLTQELRNINDIIEERALELKRKEEKFHEKKTLFEQWKQNSVIALRDYAEALLHRALNRVKDAVEKELIKVQSILDKAELVAVICTKQKAQLERRTVTDAHLKELRLYKKRLESEQKRGRLLQQKIIALERENNRLQRQLRCCGDSASHNSSRSFRVNEKQRAAPDTHNATVIYVAPRRKPAATEDHCAGDCTVAESSNDGSSLSRPEPGQKPLLCEDASAPKEHKNPDHVSHFERRHSDPSLPSNLGSAPTLLEAPHARMVALTSPQGYGPSEGPRCSILGPVAQNIGEPQLTAQNVNSFSTAGSPNSPQKNRNATHRVGEQDRPREINLLMGDGTLGRFYCPLQRNCVKPVCCATKVPESCIAQNMVERGSVPGNFQTHPLPPASSSIPPAPIHPPGSHHGYHRGAAIELPGGLGNPQCSNGFRTLETFQSVDADPRLNRQSQGGQEQEFRCMLNQAHPAIQRPVRFPRSNIASTVFSGSSSCRNSAENCNEGEATQAYVTRAPLPLLKSYTSATTSLASNETGASKKDIITRIMPSVSATSEKQLPSTVSEAETSKPLPSLALSLLETRAPPSLDANRFGGTRKLLSPERVDAVIASLPKAPLPLLDSEKQVVESAEILQQLTRKIEVVPVKDGAPSFAIERERENLLV